MRMAGLALEAEVIIKLRQIADFSRDDHPPSFHKHIDVPLHQFTVIQLRLDLQNVRSELCDSWRHG